MRTLSLVLTLAVLGCSSSVPTAPRTLTLPALRDGVPADTVTIPAPVLLSVAMAGTDAIRVTWEPYAQPGNVSVIWGTVHGGPCSLACTPSGLDQFIYADSLEAGGMTMPIAQTVPNGTVWNVTLWVTAEEAPAVSSNAISFTFDRTLATNVSAPKCHNKHGC